MISEEYKIKIRNFLQTYKDILDKTLTSEELFTRLHYLSQTTTMMILIEKMDQDLKSKYLKLLNEYDDVTPVINDILSIIDKDKVQRIYKVGFSRVLETYMYTDLKLGLKQAEKILEDFEEKV